MFEGCVALSPKGHSQSKVLSSGKFFFHGGSVMMKRLPFTWITIPIKSCGLYVHVKVGRHLLNHPTEIIIGKLKTRNFLVSILTKSKRNISKAFCPKSQLNSVSFFHVLNFPKKWQISALESKNTIIHIWAIQCIKDIIWFDHFLEISLFFWKI